MDNKIRNFFDKHIEPLHEQVRDGKISFLDLEIEDKKDSYFSTPAKPNLSYLNTICTSSERELENSLKDLWNEEADLIKLTHDLAILAFLLKMDNIERSVELSPFIYEMF